ncbi:MAG: DNA primase [Caldisericaceae bacterium]
MKDLEEYVSEIHNKVDIVEFVSQYVKLKKQGSNFVGLCPFHHEKTPSFVVSPAKQIFHCFGCGASGDVIKFAMMIENIEFKDALTKLATTANIAPPDFNLKGASKTDKEEIKSVNEKALDYYRKSLTNDVENYLLKRGLTNETIDRFGFGFAPQDSRALIDYLRQSGLTDSQIIKSGNFKRGADGKIVPYFWNRIMIPIFDVNGGVIGFSGRSFDGHEPKYLNSPDTPIFKKGAVLYPLNFTKDYIHEARAALIVEGYFDVIVLFQEGIRNVVSPMGTSFTEDQAKLLKRYADKFYFFFDNDTGGRLGAERAVETCGKADIPMAIVTSTDAQDPDEIILKLGKEKVLELINSARDPIDFIADFELATSGKTPQGIAQVADKLLNVISKISNKTSVYEYIRRISILLDTDPKFLIDQYNKNITSAKRRKTNEPLTIETNKLKTIEEILTQAVLQRKDKLALVLSSINAEEFEEPYKDIIVRATKDVEEDRTPDTSLWLDIEDSTLSTAIALSLRDPYLARDEAIEEAITAYNAYKTYNNYIKVLFEEISRSENYESIKDKTKEYNEALRKIKGGKKNG